VNFRLEIRYAVLISLLLLLWLALEFLFGVQDKYIKYQPLSSMFALSIPVVCNWLAVKEKTKLQHGLITFKQAFVTGFTIAAFASVLVVGCHFVFHTVINPDFFQNMIRYSEQRAAILNQSISAAKAGAELYFNLGSYLLQCFLGTLFFGTIISAVIAWRMQTSK
jgi:hypothetical protein